MCRLSSEHTRGSKLSPNSLRNSGDEELGNRASVQLLKHRQGSNGRKKKAGRKRQLLPPPASFEKQVHPPSAWTSKCGLCRHAAHSCDAASMAAHSSSEVKPTAPGDSLENSAAPAGCGGGAGQLISLGWLAHSHQRASTEGARFVQAAPHHRAPLMDGRRVLAALLNTTAKKVQHTAKRLHGLGDTADSRCLYHCPPHLWPATQHRAPPALLAVSVPC